MVAIREAEEALEGANAAPLEGHVVVGGGGGCARTQTVLQAADPTACEGDE